MHALLCPVPCPPATPHPSCYYLQMHACCCFHAWPLSPRPSPLSLPGRRCQLLRSSRPTPIPLAHQPTQSNQSKLIPGPCPFPHSTRAPPSSVCASVCVRVFL